MASRAVQAEFLEQRIAENTASQEIDLGSWIFDRLLVKPPLTHELRAGSIARG